ncbi:MAG: hypothetical protein WCY27_00735 [archaeon]|jgi:hypothetical protein|nr:hypothetical protein [archaeon]MDD2477395.1 hypothetical protein [Candidatus ainarchaeum sp.]MDD3084492.1 hypothetical protein [Candidatus ainarchaeum sp.]MDD4220773.1 hypothetical protein [Candidatus ainarchaeum sp.]MDD4662272.1 hypothetical protein [Candidatus ainarchaeum sp.]
MENNIFQIILNYVWFIIKLLFYALILAIPLTLITLPLRNWFLKINKKIENFLFSSSIITYVISYLLLLAFYFIPIINSGSFQTTDKLLIFILIHIVRLAIINLLITAIIIIFIFIILFIYEKFNKNSKQFNFFNLWKSTAIGLIIFFIIIILFPKLIAMLIYLIFV